MNLKPQARHPQLALKTKVGSRSLTRTLLQRGRIRRKISTPPNSWHLWMTLKIKRHTKGIYLRAQSPFPIFIPGHFLSIIITVSFSPLGRKPSRSSANFSPVTAYRSTASMVPFLFPSAERSSPSLGPPWERMSY